MTLRKYKIPRKEKYYLAGLTDGRASIHWIRQKGQRYKHIRNHRLKGDDYRIPCVSIMVPSEELADYIYRTFSGSYMVLKRESGDTPWVRLYGIQAVRFLYTIRKYMRVQQSKADTMIRKFRKLHPEFDENGKLAA